jgi:hypothetical protein
MMQVVSCTGVKILCFFVIIFSRNPSETRAEDPEKKGAAGKALDAKGETPFWFYASAQFF